MDQNVDSAAAGGFVAGFTLIYLAIAILTIVGMWKVFEKAGKPGWAAIVPIYNLIILLEIVGKPTWWIILMLIPCVNLVILVWVLNLLSKSFGQSEGFTVGLVVLFYVFIPILGLSKQYQYLGPSAAEAKGGNSLDPANYKNPFDKSSGSSSASSNNTTNPLNPNNPNNPNRPTF